jgi:hypothetical protein
VEAQTSAQSRAVFNDVIAYPASAVDRNDTFTFALPIGRLTAQCALGAAQTAGA